MLARLVVPLVARLPRNERAKRAVRSLGSRDPAARMVAVWSVVDASLKERLYKRGCRPEDATGDVAALWQPDVAGLDGLSQMLYVDARLPLSDNLLLYGDKLSMAVSLETRVPLLDLELMRFVERIPPGLKIHGLTRKYILRKAVARWVPPEVLDRRKIPFQSPIDRWLRSDLTAHVRDLLLAPGSACSDRFDRATLAAIVDEHVRGRHDHKRLLLSLVVYELWHQQFIRPPWSELRRRIAPASHRPASASER